MLYRRRTRYRIPGRSRRKRCLSSPQDTCPPTEISAGYVEPERKCEHSSTRWSALDGAPRLSYRLCVNLIRHLGYPYVNACNLEADDVCANLYHTNTVAQIYTTDTDLILMGCDIILDIMPLFPPTLRCCDVLMDLGVTYDEFLTEFVRCHTDLHEPQTLASVQSVISSLHSPPTKMKAPICRRLPQDTRGAAPTSAESFLGADRTTMTTTRLQKIATSRIAAKKRKNVQPVKVSDTEKTRP